MTRCATINFSSRQCQIYAPDKHISFLQNYSLEQTYLHLIHVYVLQIRIS